MIDIEKNRKDGKYSSKENVLRIIWAMVQPFFLFSPRPFFGWRNFLLRLFGASIGRHVHIYNSAKIYMPWNLEVGDWSSIGEKVIVYNLGKVTIGEKSTVSQFVHICAGSHDYKKKEFPLLKLPIIIRSGVWLCADCFIGPGVEVGERAIVGARGVVVADVLPKTIVVGNPVKVVGHRNG